MKKVKGVAIFGENSFRFDGGESKSMCGCAPVPPMVTPIAAGEGYNVKRTSRNYIIQIKVPIIETRKTTEMKLQLMLPVVLGEITLDRCEMY